MTFRRDLLMALASLVVVGANAGECQRIRFFEGQTVLVQSHSVKSINATDEWGWGLRIFSVSVTPPVGDEFADVFSVIIEPESAQSKFRRNICTSSAGTPNCVSYIAPSGISVAIYFRSSRGAARDTLVNKVADYVEKDVLSCP